MILDKKISIRIISNNIGYYKSIGYENMNHYYTKDVVVSTTQAQCNHSL